MTVVPEILTGGPTLPQERRLVTALPGPRTAELQARKSAAVATGVGVTMPVYAAAAGGGVVVDVDGNSLIDLGSGIAVTTLGNADPAVAAAVADQVTRFTHTCFMITGYEAYVEVAERLNRLTPGDHEKRTALFNSGAEAVENAIKIARVATKKTAVVAFDHAYHGRTNLTMSLTAKSMPYKSGFGPFAGEVYRAPMSYPYRDGLSGPDAAKAALLQIEKQVGADNLAAIIIEPIQGEGGFIVPAPGFLAELELLVHGQRRRLHRRRDPDRLRPDRSDVRLRARGCGARPDHPRQGHRRRSAARGGHRSRGDHGRHPRRRTRAAPTAATRWPAPRPSRPSTRSSTAV